MSARVPLLEVSGLVVRYGAVTAVRGIDLTIGEGEIISIVGPNGAGKTSLVSAVAGIVPPRPAASSLPANRLPASRSKMWWRRGSRSFPKAATSLQA